MLVEVAEQVEGLDADVYPRQAALQEVPEVLQPVRVNLILDLCLSMVGDLVDIVLGQTEIPSMCFRVNRFAPGSTCTLASPCRVARSVLHTTLARTSPCHSSKPITATLPMPPVPLIF